MDFRWVGCQLYCIFAANNPTPIGASNFVDMRQIIRHFTDNDAYTFSCQYYVLQTYPRAEVEYTFFDRNQTVYPEGFSDLVQQQIDLMRNVKITEEEIAFMQQRM